MISPLLLLHLNILALALAPLSTKKRIAKAIWKNTLDPHWKNSWRGRSCHRIIFVESVTVVESIDEWAMYTP